MSGTFSSFGSALSALRYSRVAMDTASNNVANANTPGYTRRMAVPQATGAPAVPALWSRWNGAGGGVEVGGIERMVDPLLSERSRTEHASLSFLNTRATSLVRFETALSEPGENGIAAALDDFKAGWHDVANNPGDEAARSQLIGRANTLVYAIKAQASAASTEWSDQRTRLDAVLTETNQVAKDLVDLNKAIAAAHNSGTDANTLLDTRDQLAHRLAQLTGASTTTNANGTVDVTLGGGALVSATGAGVLSVPGARDNTDHVSEHGSLTVTLTPPGGTAVTVVAAGDVVGQAGGELGGALQVMKSDLPGYVAKLNGFAQQLARDVNDFQAAGRTVAGDPGTPFFASSDGGTITAATLQVALTDPEAIAASTESGGGLDGSNATLVANAGLGGDAYRSLITDFGVTVASANRVASNQQVLTNQVDATWESLAGVNIDEEMVNLLAAQRAYEGASRVITTLDSVLDTLINRTGITR